MRHAANADRNLLFGMFALQNDHLSQDQLIEAFQAWILRKETPLDAIIRDKILPGNFDVLVGVNLLREGLDLPEVSLVAILDADKEGFLRSERSLIQTSGRAARNVNGEVILYGDTVTGSMQRALQETERRRHIQERYNREMGITPETVHSNIKDILSSIYESDYWTVPAVADGKGEYDCSEEALKKLESEMKAAARNLEFERAASLRDRIKAIRSKMIEVGIKA